MSKKIELNIKTENGYEVLYPKTDSSNNVVNSEILNKFGLSEDGNVSDVLNELGKYNEYWWILTQPNYTTKEAVLSTQQTFYSTADGETNNAILDYSTELRINKDTLKIELVNSSEYNMWVNSTENAVSKIAHIASLAPCYIKRRTSETIYYLPKGSTSCTVSDVNSYTIVFKRSSSVYSYYLSASSQLDDSIKAKSVSVIKSGEVKNYLISLEKDTYPYYGNGYDFLAQPYQNSIKGIQGELIATFVKTDTANQTQLFSDNDLKNNYGYYFKIDYEFSADNVGSFNETSNVNVVLNSSIINSSGTTTAASVQIAQFSFVKNTSNTVNSGIVNMFFYPDQSQPNALSTKGYTLNTSSVNTCIGLEKPIYFVYTATNSNYLTNFKINVKIEVYKTKMF